MHTDKETSDNGNQDGLRFYVLGLIFNNREKIQIDRDDIYFGTFDLKLVDSFTIAKFGLIC